MSNEANNCTQQIIHNLKISPTTTHYVMRQLNAIASTYIAS